MALINKSTNKCWWRCGERGTFLHYGCECKSAQPLWKAVWRYLKKLKMDLPFWPSNPTSQTISEGTQNTTSKEYKHPYVHCSVIYNHQNMEAAQCPSVDERIKHLYNETLSRKKEENFTLCNSMHGPGEHCAKWNKPVREQIPYYFTHMWNLMNKIN